MKIVAVIKASMISNYFPGRYSVCFGEKSLLETIVSRIRLSKKINEIVLATSDDPMDNYIVEEAESLKVNSFRTKYEDSIGRLYGAAATVKADIIVKVFGNYPLVDPWEMDLLIDEFIECNCDYAYNEHYSGLILGMGVELIKSEILGKAHNSIGSIHQRRFGSNLFKDFISQEQIYVKKNDIFRPNYRVTLATPEDVMFIDQIINETENASFQEVVNFLDKHPIIVRYAEKNVAKAHETGVDKILLFPDKIKNLNHNQGKNVDISYPVSVELSLTNRCNLDCKWCSDADLRKRNMEDLDYSTLSMLIQDLAENGTTGLVIEGGGEPTLYPKFKDVVDCAIDNNLSLGLISNGVNIPYINYLDSFDWVRISLDAANEEQFAELKGRKSFDKVMHNIELLCRPDKKGKTIVGIGYVLTSENEDGLEQLIVNTRRINVDYFQIRPVVDHENMLPSNFNIDYLQKYSTNVFSVQTTNMSENTISGNFSLPCLAHSLSSVVTANGDVFLCGRLNRYDWFEPIGNLNKNTFLEIWHGEKRREQGKNVLSPDFCRRWCPECRLTKYNNLLNNISKIKTRNFI